MKFEFDRHNLIYVPVKIIYRQEVNLVALVDTGSAGTVFNINLFDIDLFQANSKVLEIVGIGGEEEVLLQQVESIQIGNIRVNSFHAQFGDVTSDFGFDGIIGADLLKQLGSVIDYSARTIEFRTPPN